MNEITPYWFEDPARHDLAMREVAETLVLIGENEQRFSAIHVNRDFTEKPPIISINAMFTGANSPEQKYAAYQFAALHPDRSVIKIDVPAHGYSDKLTHEQYREIIGKRTLTLVANSQFQAISTRLPDLKEIVAVGDSLGGRIGFDIVKSAHEKEVHTKNLFAFDPVGLEKRLSVGVSTSYFLSEYFKSKRIYDNQNMLLSHNQAYEDKFKSELTRVGFENDFSMPAVFKKDPRFIGFLFFRSPLASDTGAEALEECILIEDQLKANIVIGGLSGICRWNKIQSWANNMEAISSGRAVFNVWQGDSHGMALAPQQPRMAQYIKQHITN